MLLRVCACAAVYSRQRGRCAAIVRPSAAARCPNDGACVCVCARPTRQRPHLPFKFVCALQPSTPFTLVVSSSETYVAREFSLAQPCSLGWAFSVESTTHRAASASLKAENAGMPTRITASKALPARMPWGIRARKASHQLQPARSDRQGGETIDGVPKACANVKCSDSDMHHIPSSPSPHPPCHP